MQTTFGWWNDENEKMDSGRGCAGRNNIKGADNMLNNVVLWKPITNYEGIYEVSNTGLVRSLPRLRRNGKNSSYYTKLKILKQSKTTTGYYKVELYQNGLKKSLKVHRLVGQAFVPNPENKPNINHKDGNPLNNNAENLEWVTQQENCIHAIETGLKPVFDISKQEIKKLYIDKNLSMREIAKIKNVSTEPIQKHIKKYGLKKKRPKEKYFLTKEYLLKETKNNSQRQLAREIGCSSSLISQYLKRIKEKGDIYA